MADTLTNFSRLAEQRRPLKYWALAEKTIGGTTDRLGGAFPRNKSETILMKLIGKTLAAFAGATLAVSPVMAAPLERTSQSAEEAGEMGGGGGAWIGILAAALVVALAAIAAFDGDSDDSPVSP